MIPYSKQSINAADVSAVTKVLRSAWLTQGPTIERFERALAKVVGAQYAVAFSSGTAALHAAYAVASIGLGDEVIVPALTFAATANAALYLGARPVFADVDSSTGLMDVRDAAKKITKRTKVIVPVDYAGRPADINAYRALARKHNLIFIADGAQSLGAKYKGQPVGSQADMTMFSFHPVKSITTGEGGAIVTDRRDFYEKMLMFRTHGLTRDPRRLREKKYAPWHQEMQVLGYNYRMTDIQAALGESQLKRLDSFVAKRRQKAALYQKLLNDVSGIVLPPADTKEKISAWHLYPLLIEGGIARRDAMFAKMREKNIGVQVHYLPVYLHPYYQDLGYKRRLCPNAEAFSFSELSIPLYPELTLKDQKFVVKTLQGILKTLA